MKTPKWVNDLFQAVDEGDVDSFVRFMTEDVHFRAGSHEPLKGRGAVREDIAGLLSSIEGMRHVLSKTLVHDDIVVAHGTVTYTRHDESTLTVPFADIWGTDGEKIKEYLDLHRQHGALEAISRPSMVRRAGQ